MAGPLSKHAWIIGFTEYLETKERCRLPNLRKPWEGAYFNWLKVRRLVRKAIHSSLDAHNSKPGDLEDLCPACFYRDPEDKSPVFLAIDGNFQHKRFAYVSRDQTVEDWGEAFVPTPEKLNAPWMERAIRTTDDVGPCDDIDSSGCPHRHAAANSTGRLKPKSFTKFDETGLMCITCRHGTGIRCLNLYGGEDRGSTLRLVQSISENLPADGKIYLLYDIACKFHPYLKRVDPGLAARITSSLNAFHVFCHDIVCQLQWGPRQTKGLGEFDGEGCERLWSGLRYLISALRFSSAQNRIDLLDARILYRGRAARRSLCASLAFALYGSKKSPGTQERLRGLEKLVDEAYRRHTPSEPCSKAQYEDILRLEFEAYKAFLLTEVKAPKGMRESYIKMLQVERHFGYGPSVEGNLQNTRLLGRSVDPSALPKEWGSLDENTKNELCSCGVVEHEWAAVHEAFGIERTWQNLDTIKFALNENYAARMLELRNIKSRASGLKEARPLMNALRRRTSKANEKINEYNRVRKLLPKECRPPKVDDQTFSIQALEATFGQFELDYGLKRVVHQGFRMSVSPDTLKAVNAIQRLDRAREEMQSIKNDVSRLHRWAVDRLRSCLRGLSPTRLSQSTEAFDIFKDALWVAQDVAKHASIVNGLPTQELRDLIGEALNLYPDFATLQVAFGHGGRRTVGQRVDHRRHRGVQSMVLPTGAPVDASAADLHTCSEESDTDIESRDESSDGEGIEDSESLLDDINTLTEDAV